MSIGVLHADASKLPCRRGEQKTMIATKPLCALKNMNRLWVDAPPYKPEVPKVIATCGVIRLMWPCPLNRLIVLAAKGYPWLICMVSVATLTPQIFSEHNHLEIYLKFFFFASPSPVFQISLTARVVLGCSRQRELGGASLSCAKVRSRRNRRSGRDEKKGWILSETHGWKPIIYYSGLPLRIL